MHSPAMDGRSPDHPGVRSLRIAGRESEGSGVVVRHDRRAVAWRSAQLIALSVVLAVVGWGLRVVARQRGADQALSNAREQYVFGTVADVRRSVERLETHDAAADDPRTRNVLALMRAHLWLEFGVGPQAARAAVERAEPDEGYAELAAAMLAFAAGDMAEAERIERSIEATPADPWFLDERAWLRGLLAVAGGGVEADAIERAGRRVAERLEWSPTSVALRRLQIQLKIAQGAYEDALSELERAREQNRSHFALAADETLYKALLHRELGAVASLADQLLVVPNDGLSRRDRAHVQLARAVAHVRSGEPHEALARLDVAWPDLAGWNLGVLELAIQTALESADASRLDAWLEGSGLDPTRKEIYRAWGTLLEGRVMEALDALERLPQDDPWVGYLQALALVEQGRFAEAAPWLERTRVLMPGRLEVEVAQARAELRLADPKLAARRLRALAEEEPYAPRAWTGLGEAYRLVEHDLREAKRALLRAIDREPIPAEAMLQLAKVWDARRTEEGDAENKALQWLEKAATINPHLPEYRIELAVYLFDLGYDERALTLLRVLGEERGIDARVPLTRARLELERGAGARDLAVWLARAEALGADPRDLDLLRARQELRDGSRAALDRAQARLSALLEKTPADVEVRTTLAEVHVRRFDLNDAKSLLLRGFSVTPKQDQGRLHLALAQAETRFGRRVQAAPRARRAWLRMLQEDRPARELLEAAELVTRLSTRVERETAALAVARELTERMEVHPVAWTLRARTELAVGETADARRSVERALALDPSSPAAHEIHGHCLLRFGARDRARQAYATALSLAPNDEDLAENLARLGPAESAGR